MKEIDIKRAEAFKTYTTNKKAPISWPTCYSCGAEFKTEKQEEVVKSCGIKNYMLCELIDILDMKRSP